jgi:protein-L-isoaspartate(D-aspartate) O-methyltransferase
VERAFRTVPRHRLLETFFHRPIDAADFTTVHHDPARPRPEDLELIYSDTALGTRLVEQFGARLPASSTSQPSLVADMLQLLELTRGVRVLEVGAGTGYNAALLAELVGEQRLVMTVDVADDVVAIPHWRSGQRRHPRRRGASAAAARASGSSPSTPRTCGA